MAHPNLVPYKPTLSRLIKALDSLASSASCSHLYHHLTVHYLFFNLTNIVSCHHIPSAIGLFEIFVAVLIACKS